jgi:hypothetical protein
MTVKNKTKKFISAFLTILIIFTVLFSKPNQAEAAWWSTWVSDVETGLTAATTYSLLGYKIKEVAMKVGEEILKVVAKQVLAKMTQATINWINTDFHGQPLFLENPDSFFRDIAKSELKSLVDLFGYNTLLYPFGKDFALSAINAYKTQFAINAQYTLNSVMNSALYRTNFNYGGWNAFLINTQYPQNNYLGFRMLATEELAFRLRGTVQSVAENQRSLLQQGLGFLSPQMCDPTVNKNYNNGSNEFNKPSFDDAKYRKDHPYPTDMNDTAAENKWEADREKAKTEWAKTNTCVDKNGKSALKNTTPGSVAANQIFNALDSPRMSTVLDGALGNSVAAILDALINHFMEKGLNSMASSVNPQPSGDNWTYGGTSLGTADTTTLTIPQNVSVIVGEKTSTNIFGGTMDYRIRPQDPISKAIATAVIDTSSSSGNKLAITGVSSGTTSIVVEDSSTPTQTVTITVTVGKTGGLMVSMPNPIDTNPDNPIVAPISGGNGDYRKITSPNESVAIAVISGSNLIVVGINKGATFVEIKDSSTPAKTIVVPINVKGPNDLSITPQSISIYEDQVINVPISGGTASYFVNHQKDPEVATTEILTDTPSMLTITGIKPGEASAIIRDSSSPYKSASIFITTLARMGNCLADFGSGSNTIKQTDKRTCASMRGTWTANPIAQ